MALPLPYPHHDMLHLCCLFNDCMFLLFLIAGFVKKSLLAYMSCTSQASLPLLLEPLMLCEVTFFRHGILHMGLENLPKMESIDGKRMCEIEQARTLE